MQIRIFLPPSARAGSAAKTNFCKKDGPNSGIAPTDTRASPPRLINARRESVIMGLLASVTLKFRRTENQGGQFRHIDCAGLVVIAFGHMLLQRGACGSGQFTLQKHLAQLVEDRIWFVDVHAPNQIRWANGN